MTFTYNLNTATGNTNIISRIRLKIGDFSEGNGPKPDGSNLSDEEIIAAYEEEGSNTNRAAALLLESLSHAWSAVPGTILVNSISIDPSRTAKHLADRAALLRQRYGFAGSTTVFSGNLTRTAES